MSLQHIKLKPVFYLKSKNSYFTKISKLQQKWEQNSSPITCEQNMIGEMEKEKRTRASKGRCNIVVFLSQALTEILHLKNTWLQFFLYFKMKQCVIWTIAPSWAINVAIFVLINYKSSKHHKTARPQPCRAGKCFILRSKIVFFYHLKYNNIYITIK